MFYLFLDARNPTDSLLEAFTGPASDDELVDLSGLPLNAADRYGFIQGIVKATLSAYIAENFCR